MPPSAERVCLGYVADAVLLKDALDARGNIWVVKKLMLSHQIPPISPVCPIIPEI